MSDELVALIDCVRCSRKAPAHKDNPKLCDDCVKAEDNRVAHYRQHNYNWMEVSKEADLALWERQPGETDHEYHVWLAYRDAYPGTKPSYRLVADQLTTSVNAVRKIASRWTFPTRLQAWAKHVDEITLTRRRQEILDMNKRHVDMAVSVNEKLQKAIARIDPDNLSPKEIVALAKLGTDLERKARLDPTQLPSMLPDDQNPELKKETV